MIKAVLTPSNCPEEFSDSKMSLSFTELQGNKSIELGIIEGGFTVSAHPLDHRTPTFGYVIQEPNIPGNVNIEKALAMGLPEKSRLYNDLKNGKEIIFEEKVIHPDEIINKEKSGKKITFLQDTFNSESAIENAYGSDILIHECTYSKDMYEDAAKWKHSTSKMAGAFAKTIAAKKLFLTHFGGRFSGKNKAGVESLKLEAEMECPKTQVITADELMHVKRIKDEFVVSESD